MQERHVKSVLNQNTWKDNRLRHEEQISEADCRSMNLLTSDDDELVLKKLEFITQNSFVSLL
jgi:hypothetical protein